MVGNSKKVSNFYSISAGKIVRNFGGNKPEGIETVERINKNGNTVYEQHFDFIEGKIIKGELKEHEEFGTSILLTIADNSETAVLQFKFDSAYGRSFLFKLPNLNLNDYVNLQPYDFVDKKTGKRVLGIAIFNPLEKVPNFYTKETPNGMPALKPIKLKGKDTWDNSEQLEFLEKKFNEFFAEKNIQTAEIKVDANESEFESDELAF